MTFLETTIDKFIFKVATDRLYSADGIWVLETDGRLRLGMTDYVQQLNGDMAFVHLKPVGTALGVGEEFADIETIKSTAGLLSPVAGTVAAVNVSLQETPETVNQDPYGKGWLAEIDPTDWPAAKAALLGPEDYLATMRAQAEEELGK